MAVAPQCFVLHVLCINHQAHWGQMYLYKHCLIMQGPDGCLVVDLNIWSHWIGTYLYFLSILSSPICRRYWSTTSKCYGFLQPCTVSQHHDYWWPSDYRTSATTVLTKLLKTEYASFSTPRINNWSLDKCHRHLRLYFMSHNLIYSVTIH